MNYDDVMGIDLYLFPLDHLSHQDSWGFSHTILNVPQDGRTFDAIRKLKPKRLPGKHNISGFLGGINDDGTHEGERVYGKFTNDPYGKPYTWVTAGDLKDVITRREPNHPTTAYVTALPSDTMIVLGWH